MFLLTKVPSPSCPFSLKPHAHSVPSDFMANEELSPASTCTQLLSVPICVGDITTPDRSPKPSRPKLEFPQAHKVPSVFMAKLCIAPVAIFDQTG
jgi:hypothetical protein